MPLLTARFAAQSILCVAALLLVRPLVYAAPPVAPVAAVPPTAPPARLHKHKAARNVVKHKSAKASHQKLTSRDDDDEDRVRTRKTGGKVTRASERDDPDDIEADDPKNEERFNRELWESIKKTPYAKAKIYVARVQKTERVREAARPGVDTIELPTGWKIAPAGAQTEVGRLPYEATAFAGKIVVVNNGYYTGGTLPEVSIIDPATGTVGKTLHFGALFPCARVGQDGDLYISGGFSKQIYRVNSDFETVRTYSLPTGYTGAIAPLDATHIAVTYLVSGETPESYDKGLYQTGRIAILNTQTGMVEREAATGYFPYALRLVGDKLYTALLGEDKVAVYDRDLKPLKTLTVGRGPIDLAADPESPDHLYVVNSNADSVSVLDTHTDTIDATIGLEDAGTRYGGAPTSCAVGTDDLFVTMANINAVAVVNKRTRKLIGYVPTGWYPTKVLIDGDHLCVLSAKGIRARRPNPRVTTTDADGQTRSSYPYVLTLLKGSFAAIPTAEIATQLPIWTQQVREGSPLFSPIAGLKVPIKHIFYIVRENRTYDQVMGDLPKANGDPSLTLFGRDTTPNAHRLAEQFVTLDNYYTDAEISVLGHSFTTSGYASPFLEWIANTSYSGKYRSYPYGSVPAVTSPAYLWDALDAKHIDYRIYGENYYLYTRGFSLIRDEFGADSAIGRKFYAQMMALASKTDRGSAFFKFSNGYYGKAQTPDAAYELLGDPAYTRELSAFLTGDDSLATALADRPKLRRKFAEYLYRYPSNYRSWDLRTSDLDRFKAWKADFDDQLKSGKVAQLQYLWLPNDHTGGAGRNPLLPDQLVAENDAALACIVQTIAASPIWKDSLILVTEDDAQDGPDHVDATRTVGLAIGPYVRRNAVVHDRYDQISLLRTIELLLGLNPLNRGDALAVPMFGALTTTPNLAIPGAPLISTHLDPIDLDKLNRIEASR